MFNGLNFVVKTWTQIPQLFFEIQEFRVFSGFEFRVVVSRFGFSSFQKSLEESQTDRMFSV